LSTKIKIKPETRPVYIGDGYFIPSLIKLLGGDQSIRIIPDSPVKISLEKDKSGNITETIKIITHSMGAVYGSGYW
jgi:hypothetical protein